MVGFLMPQSDGRMLQWGPVIEGSVAAWRLAHPAARIANLAGRQDISDADLHSLKGVLALCLAGCSQAPLTDAALAVCGPGLRALDVSGCEQLSSAALQHCSSALRELCCAYCSGLGDAAFASLKGLRALDASFCAQPELGNTALAHVGDTLQWLCLEGCTQSSLSGTYFSYLPRLQHLSFSLQERAPSAFCDAHFARFEGGPLRSLCMWNAQAAGSRCITDAAFRGGLAGLHTLELSFRAGGGGGGGGGSGLAVTRAAFAAQKGRLRRLFMSGSVPEVLKDAARAAGLEVRGK